MLEIHEILDRFELLYPASLKISDLRRSYIDRDLLSIFRLVNDDNKEDFRKLIMEHNIWKLWTLLETYSSTNFTSAFKTFYINDIKFNKDCFSRGQLYSKSWLVKELSKLDVDLGTVFLCAGWYATLSTMLFESNIKVNKIRSFDIDTDVVKVAEIFNKPWAMDNWKFKAITADILDIDYAQHTWSVWSNKNQRMSFPISDTPDTIINTSCEHLDNFAEWYGIIPVDKLVILQSNNFFEAEDHVNCVKSLEEFKNQTPMTTELYEGELDLGKYKRFMRIGYK